MERLSVFEQILFEKLMFGVENAVSSKSLAYDFRTSRRRIAKTIHDMCRKGVPIVATRKGRYKGYFLARNRQEMAMYIKPLEAEYREVMKRILKLKSLREAEYQAILNEKKEQILKGINNNE